MPSKVVKGKGPTLGQGKKHASNPASAPSSSQPPPRRQSPSPSAPPSQQHPQSHHEQQQSPPDLPNILVTSRLCVKNVPKDITVPKLKEHFSAKGEVTDVKILKTRWVPHWTACGLRTCACTCFLLTRFHVHLLKDVSAKAATNSSTAHCDADNHAPRRSMAASYLYATCQTGLQGWPLPSNGVHRVQNFRRCRGRPKVLQQYIRVCIAHHSGGEPCGTGAVQ